MAVYSWSRHRTKHFGDVAVPLAHIELQSSDNSFVALAVQIDSGAVVSLLRRSVADLLGISLESGRQVELSSVGGAQTKAYVHELVTRFSPDLVLTIPYAIADTERVPNLLGRLGVFDKLQVDFDATVRETKIAPPWLSEKQHRCWTFMLDTCKHVEQRWDQLKLSGPARKATCELYGKASRLYVAAAGLVKLGRPHEAPILIRALFEVAAQFEYLMQDPNVRGEQFVDYSHVSLYHRAMETVRDPRGPVGRTIAASPLREEGEPWRKENYKRVRGQFAKGKKGKEWPNWYCMNMHDLAGKIGWENEYNMWYRAFSNWVHSDPSQMRHPPYDGSTVLFLCDHYLARMLLRIAEVGKIVLAAEQDEALTGLSEEFV